MPNGPRRVKVSIYRPTRAAKPAELAGLPCRDGKKRKSKVRPNKRPGGNPRVQTSIWWFLTRIDGRKVQEYCYSSQTSNKSEAASAAAELQSRLYRGEVGLDDQFAEHRDRPIGEHLADYVRFLEEHPDNRADDYRKQVNNRVQELIKLANLKVVGDLQFDAVSRALGRLKTEKKLAPGTLNSYRSSICSFANWLVKARRLAAHQLNELPKADPNRDRRRRRRALSEEDFNKLLDAAMRGPVIEHCSGPERAMAYLLIAHTTWRRRAIQSLQVMDFSLEGDEPFASLPESKSKSKKDVPFQPIRKDVAALVVAFIKSKGLGPKDRLVPRFSKHASSEGIRADLAAAGVPHQDVKGLFADFHSLRGRTNTEMAVAGVPVAVRQAILGVSDPRLVTGAYHYAPLAERRAALEKLPPPPALEFSQPCGSNGLSKPLSKPGT